MSESALFSETRFGGLTLGNRIVVSSMAQYSSPDGAVVPWHDQHLGAFAASGAGLVMIESNAVEPDGRGCTTALGLYDDAQEAALTELVTRIRSYSTAKLGIQIGHSGRKASTAIPLQGGHPLAIDQGGWTTFAPSAIAFGEGWSTPEKLDEEGISRLRRLFSASVSRAARAGLDLVELHGAHGYLLHSFLSPVSNQRTDSYGGSFENRLRFVREVVADARAALPAPRALGIRLNSHDWVSGGLEIEDTVRITSALGEAGCDYVCVSAGAISSDAKIQSGPGYLAPYAEILRRKTGIPTMVTGLVYDPRLAEEIVREGRADAVAVARAFLDNPRWAWRAAEILGVPLSYPMQYVRSHPTRWAGAAALRGLGI